MLQLLAGAKPHDLGLGRVQPQSAGSHPLVDVVDTDSEAVKCERLSVPRYYS